VAEEIVKMGHGDYKLVPLSKEDQKLVEEVRGENSAMKTLLKTEPQSVTLVPGFIHLQKRILNMKVRQDDVWIITPPKCGTTWTQEITWLLMNKADVVTAKEKDLFSRSPFLEMPMMFITSDEEAEEVIGKLDSMPSPRLIKSHLPFELLPPDLLDTCKVVFVARNVKDAAVSFFYHERLMKHHDLIDMSFERYAREVYKPSLTVLGGFFEMLGSGWKRRNHPNMLFLWYESMKEDQRKVISEIAEHIGYQLTDAEMDTVDEYTRFDNLRKTCSINQPSPMFHSGRGSFLRKGKVGDWTSHFSAELAREWSLWADQELNKIGVSDTVVRGFFGSQ